MHIPLAKAVSALPFAQINVQMVLVKCVGARAEHCRKAFASAGSHVLSQSSARIKSIFHDVDCRPITHDKPSHVECVARSVFAYARAALSIAPAACMTAYA